jgi:hypothetical protein
LEALKNEVNDIRSQLLAAHPVFEDADNGDIKIKQLMDTLQKEFKDTRAHTPTEPQHIDVDDMLYSILKELGIESAYNKSIKKLSEGVYQVGSKKLNMKILSGKDI